MKILTLAAIAACLATAFSAPGRAAEPVNPNATPEARKLLDFLYTIKGRYTLSAQHNYIATADRSMVITKAITGKTPLIYGSDFSFAYQGNSPEKFQHCGPLNLTPPGEPVAYTDATPEVVRKRLIETIIRLHRAGHIITLDWHGGMGTGDVVNGNEIWTWDRRPTQAQWDELTTDGTPLNLAWQKQVDRIADYLKELMDARVPVLWRPYHEMNGIWFWWCDKPGENGFKKLWIMMYKRFVDVHHLNNLLWVWNTNAPRNRLHDEAGPYEDYWPGAQYVDILGADVYHGDWKQSHHDDLLKLANGKPIALCEVGDPPTPELLARQPNWAWFMPWAIQLQNAELLKRTYADKRVLSLEDVVPQPDGGYTVKSQP